MSSGNHQCFAARDQHFVHEDLEEGRQGETRDDHHQRCEDDEE